MATFLREAAQAKALGAKNQRQVAVGISSGTVLIVVLPVFNPFSPPLSGKLAVRMRPKPVLLCR